MRVIKSLIAAAIGYALIVYGIPYVLEYLDMPLLDQILSDAVLQWFGIMWAVLIFLRHLLLKKKGFFARFLRTCILLAGFVMMGWFAIEEAWPQIEQANVGGIADISRKLTEKKDELAFTPDASKYSYHEQREGMPLVAVQSSLSQTEIEQLLAANVYSLPAWLLGQARAIYILDESSFQQALTDHSINALGRVAGFSNYSYNDSGDGILRSNNDEEVFIRLDDITAHTVAHELSHCYDFEHDITQKNENGPYHEEIVNLYHADPDVLSRYGATDISEYFAEAGAAYIMDAPGLSQTSPELYAIFSDLYGTQ